MGFTGMFQLSLVWFVCLKLSIYSGGALHDEQGVVPLEGT